MSELKRAHEAPIYILCMAMAIAIVLANTQVAKAVMPKTITLQSIQEELFAGVETFTFLSDNPKHRVEMTESQVERLKKAIGEGTELGESNYVEPGDLYFVLTWTDASGIKISTSLAYQKDRDLIFVDKSNVHRAKKDEYSKNLQLVATYLVGAYKFKPGVGFGELVGELLQE